MSAIIKQHGAGDRPASEMSSPLWSTPQIQEAVATAFLRENAEPLSEVQLTGPDRGRVATGTIIKAEIPIGNCQGHLKSLTRTFSRGESFEATANYVIEAKNDNL